MRTTWFSWNICSWSSLSFGNFVNRALKFVAAQYNSVIPDSGDAPGPYSPNDENDAEFISEVNSLLKEYTDAMDAVKLRAGLQTVMAISARGNLYLQASGLNKQLMSENPKRCAQVVSRALNLIYVLSALVHPFMPSTETAMLTQLNAPPRAVPATFAHDLLAGHAISTPEHLFKRIDEKMADIWRDKFGGLKPKEDSALAQAADATHVAPGMSKRKAAAAKKKADKEAAAAAAENAGPKSAEVLAWEQKVAEQATVVRELKAKPKSEEGDKVVATAVEELKRLKAELAEMVKQQQA